ncbi:MAG: RNA polymerase sigma factor (sigma-70 family) [Paraglaciecola sp.]|jgi:RNA polymerase sigma factor (sigma-70 family)
MNKQLTAIVPMLRRFAYSLTGSMPDADDLVQSTIEKILNKGIPDEADLTKWAFRLCRNVWIDEYRANKTRQAATQNPELQEQPEYDQDKRIATNDALHQVNQAMNTLGDDQRAVLSFVAVQGMSYKQVSEILDVPVGTVMSRLSRARIALIGLIGHLSAGETT